MQEQLNSILYTVNSYIISISKKNRQHNGQKKKYKQRSTKHTYKTKDLVTRTQLKSGDEVMCSGRVSSSCSTSGTHRVNLVTNPLIPRTFPSCLELSIYIWDSSNKIHYFKGSSTNKSDCHDITEICLKVAINTINQLTTDINFSQKDTYRNWLCTLHYTFMYNSFIGGGNWRKSQC
jgi:hypothetical protein